MGLLRRALCVYVSQKWCQAVETVDRQGGLDALICKSQLIRALQMCYSVLQVLGWTCASERVR